VTTLSYTADDIRVLAGLDGVRMRPAMYVGGTDSDALHRMVLELLDNAVDEALSGGATAIRVTLDEQSCAVEDNGRGVPLEGAKTVLTELHAGAKFGGTAYGATGGLHGVGLSCVNALSEKLVLETWRGERGLIVLCKQGRFQRAYATKPPHKTGSKVTFWPDRTVLDKGVAFQPERILRRARELSFLVQGLSISVQQPGSEQTFCSEEGLGGLTRELTRTRVPLFLNPIVVSGEHDGVRVDAALQWTNLYADDTHAWVNMVLTGEGGTHVTGAHKAVAEVVRRLDAELGSGGLRLTPIDTREGLTLALSIRLHDPQFGGQTKETLVSQVAQDAVQTVVQRELQAWFASNAEIAQRVVDKARSAAKARHAALRARDRIRHHSDQVVLDDDAYRTQFGIRSANWHDSAEWIANGDLLAKHADMTRVPAHSRLLDVCCGSGVVGASFRGKVAHLTGLDITPEMVALASQRLDHVVQGTVFDMPFEDDSFDIVSNREVMHLFPHPEKMLSEVRRVLKPGGQFIFGQIVPFGTEDAPWMHRIFAKKQPLLHHMFLHEDLLKLLADNGFEVAETAETTLWEWIDVWIDTWETSALHRHEIRELYYNAPAEVRAVHPIEITPQGRIRDLWRWVVYSSFTA
jgi:DNA gyrase subunit B